MISQRILNMFKSHEDDNMGLRNYITIITDIIDNSDSSCDQESIIIKTKEFRIPYKLLTDLEGVYGTAERTLEIISSIDIDQDKNYYGKLTGFLESTKYSDDESRNELGSHEISVVKTPLANEIYIEFDTIYKDMPYISLTIEKENETLYRSYSTEFDKIEENGEIIGYTGVTITFNGLRSKTHYPNVGIMIIGDIIEDYFEEYEGEKKIINFVVIEETIDKERKPIKDASIFFENLNYTLYTNSCGEAWKTIYITEGEQTYNIQVSKEGYTAKTVECEVNEDVQIIILEAEHNEGN